MNECATGKSCSFFYTMNGCLLLRCVFYRITWWTKIKKMLETLLRWIVHVKWVYWRSVTQKKKKPHTHTHYIQILNQKLWTYAEYLKNENIRKINCYNVSSHSEKQKIKLKWWSACIANKLDLLYRRHQFSRLFFVLYFRNEMCFLEKRKNS